MIARRGSGEWIARGESPVAAMQEAAQSPVR
jgi:hypothetical protein